MDKYTIYKFTFPDGKVYIGQTKKTLEERWGKEGKGYLRQPVYKIIEKFGWNNIKKEILFTDLNKKEAEDKEAELIEEAMKEENTYNKINGITRYNYKDKWIRNTPDEIKANEKLRQALTKVLKGYQLTLELLDYFNKYSSNRRKWVNNIPNYGISFEEEKYMREKLIAIKNHWDSIEI